MTSHPTAPQVLPIHTSAHCLGECCPARRSMCPRTGS